MNTTKPYQPKTGAPCHCKPGKQRDNCPDCEGTGMRIDFAAIRARASIPATTLTKQQYKSFGPRAVDGYGEDAAIWAHVRYDDECGNGHNTFAITGTVRQAGPRSSVGFIY